MSKGKKRGEMKRRRKIYDIIKKDTEYDINLHLQDIIFLKKNIFQQKFVRNSMCVRIKYISLWFRVVLLLILKCFCNFSLQYLFFYSFITILFFILL